MSKDAQEQLPKIVCLCGSTRFWDDFTDAAYQNTIRGNIVLMPHVCKHAHSKAWTKEYGTQLDELHLRKIDLADEVLIINVDGYVGESTRNEVLYAVTHNKNITWWWPEEGKRWEQDNVKVHE